MLVKTQREESGLDFRYRTLCQHDSPTPEASCRATCDKLSPSSIRPPLLHFRTYTTTHHKPDQHRVPTPTTPAESTPEQVTYSPTNQTQHIPRNGPSKGVPRDAARVRQGRPPVHHQVQQAYVFTLSLLAKKPRKGKNRGAFIRWAQHPSISRQIATSRTCSSLPPSTHARIARRT